MSFGCSPSFDIIETNKNDKTSLLKKCRNSQINLIKSCLSPSSPHRQNKIRSISTRCNNVESLYDTIGEVIHTNPILKQRYDIVSVIYEKQDRVVYVVEDILHKQLYLMKIKSTKISYEREYNVYCALNKQHSTYIANFVDFGIDDNFYYFVYEYFDGCNLVEYLADNPFMDETLIVKIFTQIVKGTEFLHSHNVIHCDLKLGNIMINKHHEIKIVDFDLSVVCNQEYIAESPFGTKRYMAPESCDLYIYSDRSDVWSLGIILYLLVTNKFPYKMENSSMNSYNNMYRYNKFKHPDIDEIRETIINKQFNLLLLDLVQKMLIFEDFKRASVEEILESQWLETVQ